MAQIKQSYLMLCSLCGEFFDKRNLSEVAEHEHTVEHSLIADNVVGIKGQHTQTDEEKLK